MDNLVMLYLSICSFVVFIDRALLIVYLFITSSAVIPGRDVSAAKHTYDVGYKKWETFNDENTNDGLGMY